MRILFPSNFWFLQKAKMDFFFLQFSYYLVQDKGRDNGNEVDEREQEQLRWVQLGFNYSDFKCAIFKLICF